jgi:ribosomal-protein-alanine N-acetyltransferase
MKLDPIETNRLSLRLVEERDAASVASLITPSISRWTATWPPALSVEAAHARLKSAVEDARRGLAIVFAIERKSDGILMGLSGVHRKEPQSRRCSFGYWLGEPFHGNGYMSEAAAEIIRRTWSLLDVDVIEAGAQPENTASIAILRKLGMHGIGTRIEYAPVRNRDESCAYFEISRPT